MYRRFAIALVAASALISASSTALPKGEAQLVTQTTWQLSLDWFGGFSAIEVSPNGRNFVALTDRSHIIRGAFVRKDGRIDGVYLHAESPLLDLRGKFDDRADSEGLAQRRDGSLVVSFEGDHRLASYRQIDSAGQSLPPNRFFQRLQSNGGLEALAVDRQGRLFTLPEYQVLPGKGIPVYRFDDQGWSQPFFLPKRGGFRPVGADFGPDGRFYLLERSYSPFGFRSRVRSFQFASDAAFDERLILQSQTGTYDNLEGLSVWRDAKGRLRLTMISDDNFRVFQKTEIVEYILH